ncbi:MAG TPA: SgcJ/EcaC family oxidoreductase [Paludibacter sp.]
MKKLMTSTLLLLVTLLPGYSFGQNSFSKADSLAIKKASHAFEVAFNTHDAKALANLFLPNGEFTNVVGATATGRKAIEEFHAPMFAGNPGYFSFKYSTLKNEVPKITVIKPDVASVDILWTMDKCFLPDGTESKNRRGLITLLMVRKNDQWGIRIMHNVELPPMSN